jgi:hypothetical protein
VLSILEDDDEGSRAPGFNPGFNPGNRSPTATRPREAHTEKQCSRPELHPACGIGGAHKATRE